MGSTARHSHGQAGIAGCRLLPVLLVLILCGSLLPGPVQAQPDLSSQFAVRSSQFTVHSSQFVW